MKKLLPIHHYDVVDCDDDPEEKKQSHFKQWLHHYLSVFRLFAFGVLSLAAFIIIGMGIDRIYFNQSNCSKGHVNKTMLNRNHE